jgi:hypothetical protein
MMYEIVNQPNKRLAISSYIPYYSIWIVNTGLMNVVPADIIANSIPKHHTCLFFITYFEFKDIFLLMLWSSSGKNIAVGIRANKNMPPKV